MYQTATGPQANLIRWIIILAFCLFASLALNTHLLDWIPKAFAD
jgi:hypothetical protein